MRIYSLDELLLQQSSALARFKKFDERAHALFLTMSLTGLRFEDTYNGERWQPLYSHELPVPSDERPVAYSVVTAKHSNPRVILASDVSPRHAALLRANPDNPFGLSYATYLRYFHMQWLPTGLHVGDKPVETHIFRHIKAKALSASGLSHEEVRMYLGERTLSSAVGYINSVIYSTP